MALDIGCAFLYANVARELFIELPEEDPRAGSGDYVGRLLKALYGTRDAPQLWQRELCKTVVDLGFASSCLHQGVFWHHLRELTLVSHVDDLLVCGPEEELVKLRDQLKQIYEIKREDHARRQWCIQVHGKNHH